MWSLYSRNARRHQRHPTPGRHLPPNNRETLSVIRNFHIFLFTQFYILQKNDIQVTFLWFLLRHARCSSPPVSCLPLADFSWSANSTTKVFGGTNGGKSPCEGNGGKSLNGGKCEDRNFLGKNKENGWKITEWWKWRKSTKRRKTY